jgi:hypothetical protein
MAEVLDNLYSRATDQEAVVERPEREALDAATVTGLLLELLHQVPRRGGEW